MYPSDNPRLCPRGWLCAALAGALVLASGCASRKIRDAALPPPYRFDGKGIAVLSAFDGYVMARPSPGVRWMRVTRAAVALPQRAQLRTEAGAASVKIAGVGMLRLGPKTVIDLSLKKTRDWLLRSRLEYEIFFERGEVTAVLDAKHKDRIRVRSDLARAELIRGQVKIVGAEPMVVACEQGRAVVRLDNGATASVDGAAAVAVRRVSDGQMRITARRDRVKLGLGRNRCIVLSADGFNDDGVCPCEVDIAED